MGIRVKKHGGDHTWVLKEAKGACGYCLAAHGRVLALKMKWECNVPQCGAKKTTKHKHV